jgi:stearoyl-CoA desaturase (Delta-9 desaturase)
MNFLSNILHAVLSFLDGGLFDLSVWQMVVYTLVVTHITIAGVTIYLHRHQAHRALDLHPIPSHFFRFWLWLTTGQVTKEWAAVHRKHHAKCETVDDPHSPVTRGIKEVLLRGAELYRAETKNQETLSKYGHGCPNDWIENNLYTKYSWLGVSMLLPLSVALFGVAGITIWAVQMLWIPITAAGIINGIGHYWGYRNYDCNDAATNIMPWGIIIGGEELHNNHHTFATSAKLSSKWYEFDIGWAYIRMMEMVGLAKVKKTIPKPRLQKNKLEADFDTLQAVIANRYDVMAKYAKSVKHAFREEVEHLKQKAELPEEFAQADATRTGQAAGTATGPAGRTVPAQQSPGNDARDARGTGRDLGTLALDPRPAAAPAAGLVRPCRSVRHQVAARVLDAPAQLRVSITATPARLAP